MISLPQLAIDEHFEKVKERVDARWDLLAKEYEFPLYSPEKDDNTILEEFYHFSNLRLRLWLRDPNCFPCESNPLFKVSQEHLLAGRYRQPNCITFEHSATDSSYNSTSIQIGKRRFLAMEGPFKDFVPYFFRLLVNWKAHYLVCLTDQVDKAGTPKCYPYWKGRIVEKEEGQFLRVSVDGSYEEPTSDWGTKELPYEFWPSWEDHHGVDPELLVKAADRVRKALNENQIIAVHCSGGVGRTGTFISAICLLDMIDEQLANGATPEEIQLSIAQLFYYLNFHRPWLVAKPGQYLTLYRTVDWYLNDLKKKEALEFEEVSE